jgi:hypothetical protein
MCVFLFVGLGLPLLEIETLEFLSPTNMLDFLS